MVCSVPVQSHRCPRASTPPRRTRTQQATTRWTVRTLAPPRANRAALYWWFSPLRGGVLRSCAELSGGTTLPNGVRKCNWTLHPSVKDPSSKQVNHSTYKRAGTVWSCSKPDRVAHVWYQVRDVEVDILKYAVLEHVAGKRVNVVIWQHEYTIAGDAPLHAQVRLPQWTPSLFDRTNGVSSGHRHCSHPVRRNTRGYGCGVRRIVTGEPALCPLDMSPRQLQLAGSLWTEVRALAWSRQLLLQMLVCSVLRHQGCVPADGKLP